MLELADIIRAAGPSYREAHGPRLLPSHRWALDDLVTCRAARDHPVLGLPALGVVADANPAVAREGRGTSGQPAGTAQPE